VPRPNDKKKGVFSRIFNRQSPEDGDRAKVGSHVEALRGEREEALDKRRDLKTQIDRLSDRARAKKREMDAASGPRKKILERELKSILRPLQNLVKQDNRLDVRINQLDSVLDKADEALIVTGSVMNDELIDDITDFTDVAIDMEDERQSLVADLTDMNFETAQDEISADDMLADLGMDLDEPVEQETAPQIEQTSTPQQTSRQTDTTEQRISEGKRELDRLMAELDEED